MDKKDRYWHRIQNQLKKESDSDYSIQVFSDTEIQLIIAEYVDEKSNELTFHLSLIN